MITEFTGSTRITGNTDDLKKKLNHRLKELHLPTMRNFYPPLCELAMKESMSYEEFLLGLLEKECDERRSNGVIPSNVYLKNQNYLWKKTW